MPRDDDSLIDLDELASILRASEGQPQAVAQRRRRRLRLTRRLRWTVAAAAAALLLGSGLGFGLGSSVTPSGDAADPPAGLGFLPERGWQVVRSRFEATAEQPSFAIASNVPLTPLDARMARRKDWSGQPHESLQSLRPGGIVIVASFALRGVHAPSDASFPRRKLPLRLRDAAQSKAYWLRRALGLYELRAAVGEHNVIVSVYFGASDPEDASMIAAQRQLDRLVVGSTRPAAHVAERALPLRPAAGTRVVDRTFVCTPQTFAGVGDLNLVVSPARQWAPGGRLTTHLVVRTGSWNPTENLVFVRSRPMQNGTGWYGAAKGAPGVFAHSRDCGETRAPVPLSAKGLTGPPLQWEKTLDCPVRGRVLVHVRSLLDEPSEWRRADRWYVGARGEVVETRLAVRLQKTGKPIAYMEHDAEDRTKLWYSAGCS